MNPILASANIYSPISEVSEDGGESEVKQADHCHLTKTYGLFDLLCVGVGATVGSGVFVLTGFVAHDIAGPGVVLSWIIAGLACCLSATSFAELSSRFPTSTSSYSFARHTLGEWAAYLAAWGLSLECGLSAAAVSRSWGQKLVSLVASSSSGAINASTDEWGFNCPAFLLQVAVVILFLAGKDVSKTVINIFTVAKVLLIGFMIILGLLLFQVKNFEPTIVPMGWNGVMRGATLCFFGFVGYDEVCCLALETKHARKLMPRAVFGTIALVCTLYGLSSVALVGMEDYRSINRENGYAMAFAGAGYPWAAIITATGEMVMLPLVVILSLLPQPRILAALARDHLAPSFLAVVTERGGNLTNAILVCGILASLIAAFVPFVVLNDLISAGVLLSFNITNTSLILIRCNNNEDDSKVAYRVDPSSESSSADDRNHPASSETQFSTISDRKSKQSRVPEQEKSITNFCKYLVNRANEDSSREWFCLSKCQWLLLAYHIVTVVVAIQLSRMDATPNQDFAGTISLLIVTIFLDVLIVILLHIYCPDKDKAVANRCSESSNSSGLSPSSRSIYRTPVVPLIPLLGIFINSLLIFQLSTSGLWVFFGYFCLATFFYVMQKLYVYITIHNIQNLSPNPSSNRAYYHCPDNSLLSKPVYELTAIQG
jgi:APA family basic amino acid/polyamine antiporter